MARYDERPVPRGTSRRWEVLLSSAEGARLKRRREYLDLHDPARADFRAEGTETVRPGQRIVARAEVSDECWAELRAACDRVARRRPLRRASEAGKEQEPGLSAGLLSTAN